MKLPILLLSSLMAFATQEGKAAICDPAKITKEFFKDGNCLEFDGYTTQQYGTIEKDVYYQFDGKCHQAYGSSFTQTCDSEGFHLTTYQDSNC